MASVSIPMLSETSHCFLFCWDAPSNSSESPLVECFISRLHCVADAGRRKHTPTRGFVLQDICYSRYTLLFQSNSYCVYPVPWPTRSSIHASVHADFPICMTAPSQGILGSRSLQAVNFMISAGALILELVLPSFWEQPDDDLEYEWQLLWPSKGN